MKVADLLKFGLQAEEVVLGGGNAKFMKDLPSHVMVGSNSNAVIGGLRLWQDAKGNKTAELL